MKYQCILIFMFLSNTLFAQFRKDNIYGSWVVSKITYADGSGLADENVLKYAYIRYRFSPTDKFNASTAYYEQGDENVFEIDGAFLQIRTTQGGLMNSFHVEVNKDTLILLQKGLDDFNDPNALKFYFIPESNYQNSILLKFNDIYSVDTKDTVYRSSPKMYARFNGNSFQRFIYAGISDRINMHDRVGHLVAGFIVSKTGYADSVKILEGIDAGFNKQFIKVFNQAKKSWKPAILNGKPVSVYTMVDLRYSTSATAMPAYFSTQKANTAYNDKDYKLALYYYDLALNDEPSEKENLYKRGMCKLFLGVMGGACDDWNKAKALGSNTAIDAVMAKYCK